MILHSSLMATPPALSVPLHLLSKQCPRGVRVCRWDEHDCGPEVHGVFIDLGAVVRSIAPSVVDADESSIIGASLDHVSRIVREFAPTDRVYVAVDGPMPRGSAVGRRRTALVLGRRAGGAGAARHQRWSDTLLTPGTRFADRLSDALREAAAFDFGAARGVSERVVECGFSTADEPGEAVQKLVAAAERSIAATPTATGTLVLFGDDVERGGLPILASMARLAARPPGPSSPSSSCGIRLVRQPDPTEGPMQSVDVRALARSAATDLARRFCGGAGGPRPPSPSECVLEYVVAASLLGNDSLPRLPGLPEDSGEALSSVLGALASALERQAPRTLLASASGPDSLAGFDLVVLADVMSTLADGTTLSFSDCYDCREGCGPDDVARSCVEYLAALVSSASYVSRGLPISLGVRYQRAACPSALALHHTLQTDRIADRVAGHLALSHERHEIARGRSRASHKTWHALGVLPACDADLLADPVARAVMTRRDYGALHLFADPARHPSLPLPPQDEYALQEAICLAAATAAEDRAQAV